jgi:hypothetical protein
VETLTRFGEQYLRHLVLRGQTVRMFRILDRRGTAQSRARAHLLRRSGRPARAGGSQTYLEKGPRPRRCLQVPDCALAAEQFLALCKGSTHLQFLLNLIPAAHAQDEMRAQNRRAPSRHS